jgi:hypothetical protein
MIEVEKTRQITLLDFTMRIQGRNLTLRELKAVLCELGISKNENK